MIAMVMRTTTIGAYPKPDTAPVPNWFDLRDQRRGAPTAAFDGYLADRSDAAIEALDLATQEVVREQVALGIDIPTDGEVRREHYVYYHCRHLEGFAFSRLTEKAMRDGSWISSVPTIIGRLGAGGPFLPHDWRIAQAVSARPVKITVPGPMTIIDSTADAYYGTEPVLARALADVLNVEIRRLADAGCAWIQIDEPVLARKVGQALDHGIECLSRCFHGVPAQVNKVVHICCGYPDGLDLPDYPKADPAAYFSLAEALDAAAFDAVSIEDAHRPNDLRLFEKFRHKTIILGLINIARTAIEPVDAIAARLRQVLAHVDPGRLIAAPDCGLTMLPRALARAKLTNLVAATRAL